MPVQLIVLQIMNLNASMTSFSRLAFAPIALACALALIGSDAFAQRPRTLLRRSTDAKREADANAKTRAKAAVGDDAKVEANTTVTVEILTGDDAGGLRSTEWRPVFDSLGYSVTMRRGTSRDKVEVRERMLGRLRE